MDHHPIRSQVSALEAQLISLEQSLALLPADQRALVGADLDRTHAAITRLLATIGSEPVRAGNPGEGAAGTPEIAPAPAADQPVWTAERTTRLYAISTALSVALTPARVASVVVNQTLPALSAAAAMIMLAGDNGVLKLVDAAGSGRIATAPDPTSPLAEVARTGQPAWLETPQDILARYPGWPDAMATPPASLAVVPLIVQGRVSGVMAVGFAAPTPFTIADRAFMLVLAQQCSSALERVELYEQVRQAAALEERNRLARDLHDSVSQALYAIVLSVNAGRSNLAKDLVRVARALDNIESLTAAAQADLRALLFDLRRDSVVHSGLVNALAERAQFLRLRHGLAVRTDLCPEPALGPACKEALYGIAREALHNAAKHARSNEVRLKLLETGQGLVLEINDDGIGFDPLKPRPRHYGLRSMRERAAELNIQLSIDSAPGQGTRITAIVPLGDSTTNGEDSARCWERGNGEGGPTV